MNDFPGRGPLPLVVHTWSRWSAFDQLFPINPAGPASISWAVANLSVFIPIYLPWDYPVARVFWVNGSTVAGNANFGIFTPTGKRIYSTGSTAASGGSALQFVTPTPFTLSAGPYYFAYANDGTTNRSFGSGITTVRLNAAGVLNQTSNLALSDPAVFATAGQTSYELCGITRVDTSIPF
jgi:hypothetical protein